MRLSALALLLFLGTSHAHADLVTFQMTGTITQLSNTSTSPIALGDKLGWTLQYDRSLPTTATTGILTYSPTSPVIFNIVDRTTGTPIPSPPRGTNYGNQWISLYHGDTPVEGTSFLTGMNWSNGPSSGQLSLYLGTSTPIPPLPILSNLELNKIPFDQGTLYFSSSQAPPSRSAPGTPTLLTSFEVQVDSLPSPVSSTPEPGALTLFLLGVLGLAASKPGTTAMAIRASSPCPSAARSDEDTVTLGYFS